MNQDCVINPKTGRAVKKTSALGKKLMAGDETKKHDCVINPATGRAVRKDTKLGKSLLASSSQSLSSPPERIKTLKQFGGTCWFNSLIMSIFYSDASRALILNKYELWDVDNKIYKTFRNILLKQYVKAETDNIEYNMFNAIRPENVLKELYKYNPAVFNFNPDTRKSGYMPELYLKKLYEFFGVSAMYLELYMPPANNRYLEPSLIYAPINYITEEQLIMYRLPGSAILLKESILEELNKDYDVIIVKYVLSPDNVLSLPDYYKVPKGHKLYKFMREPTNKIKIDNDTYKMDCVGIASVKLASAPSQVHAICGITVKGKKSVYNGWTRQYSDDNVNNSNKRNIPCELLKYNWDTSRDDKFRLGKDCKLTFNENYDQRIDMHELQFSFGKSAQSRLFYYVKHVSKPTSIPIMQ